MLIRLSVGNYALIDSLAMELGRGLNIITGETGAGKSILLGALGLVLGNRADTAALKDNGENCIIEGEFDIEGYRLESFFEENELEYEPRTVIRRVITPAGKSRAYVNDMPVQLTTLKELSSRLIDIHSQHQSLMVGDEGFRTKIIDSVADGGMAAVEKYRASYDAMRAAERNLARLKSEAEQNKRDEDYLRFQYEQIAGLKLREGEQEELESEQRELANAGQIQESLGAADQALQADETGILTQLKFIEQGLRHICDVYPRGEEIGGRLQSAYVELKDIAAEISSEAERVESNPARLSEVDSRLDVIYSLIHKHRLENIEELMRFEKELAAKLEAISNSDEEIETMRARVSELHAQAVKEAAGITAIRLKAAEKLGAGVERTLGLLGMPSSRFVCEITPARELTPTGADEIRFLFSANRSVAPQPLERIASGGEISRVMLSLKSIVARSTMLPTIIFDEIDTGVSGRIADAMGGIIADLAQHMQVINITHLPQVASKGGSHFLVYKDESPQGVQTHIRLLDPEERVSEIAKMLSGSHITDAAMTQARSLLGCLPPAEGDASFHTGDRPAEAQG